MIDVIIVGAGPSGSFSAINLANAGLRVAIIEKSVFPRIKLCGGGISPRANKMVSKFINLDEYEAIKISSTYASYKNEKLIKIEPHPSGYSIERSLFDNILLEKAEYLGAKLFMPVTVKTIIEHEDFVKVVFDNNDSLKSKYLILAEGINGMLHKQLGYKGSKKNTMALEMDIFPSKYPQNLKNCNFFDFGSIKKGYAWMFPKINSINTGAYFYNSQNISKNQKDSLYQFLNQFEWMKNAKLGNLKGYPIPRKIKYDKYNTSRTMLVGDACGAAENMFGEGIYLGLYSAWSASEVLIDSIKENTSLDYYSTVVQNILAKKLMYSRFLARIFYGNQKYGFNFLIMNVKINKIYQQYLDGKIPSKKVLIKILLHLPFSRLTKALVHEEMESVGLKNEC